MSLQKILYVDDEYINLQLFKFNFQKDFELHLASSGTEALMIIEQENIDVIISDLKMPGMNGIELIDQIKEHNPKKICMMLSAYNINEALAMGLNRSKIHKYLEKPWNRLSLLIEITNAFGLIS